MEIEDRIDRVVEIGKAHPFILFKHEFRQLTKNKMDALLQIYTNQRYLHVYEVFEDGKKQLFNSTSDIKQGRKFYVEYSFMPFYDLNYNKVRFPEIILSTKLLIKNSFNEIIEY